MVCSTLISVNTSSEDGFYRFNLITLFMLEMAQKHFRGLFYVNYC